MKVLGIDPGAAHIGWAVVEREIRSWHLVAKGEVTATDWTSLLGGIAWGAPQDADLIAIERVEHGFNPMALTPLLETARISGLIEGVCRSRARAPIVYLSATKWRRQLVGKGNPSDAEVARVLRHYVPELATVRTNAHQRDAMGVAIACGIRMNTARAVGRPASDT